MERPQAFTFASELIDWGPMAAFLVTMKSSRA
jgi:hypothetical protein